MDEVEAVREHWQRELSKAVSVIAEVGRERNALRAELDAAQAGARRAEALEVEVERLRSALEPFADYNSWDGVDDFTPPGRRMDYVDVARRALGMPAAEQQGEGDSAAGPA